MDGSMLFRSTRVNLLFSDIWTGIRVSHGDNILRDEYAKSRDVGNRIVGDVRFPTLACC
jgi:hypothetical protein